MAYEIATILLGAGFAAAIVIFAVPRGYFGRSRRKTVSNSVALLPSGSERFSKTSSIVPSAPAEGTTAPPPAPTAYETVQPKPASPTAFLPPEPASFSGSTSTGLQRYKRRSTPARTSSRTVQKSKRH